MTPAKTLRAPFYILNVQFRTSEVLANFDNALHANVDILFYNEDVDKVRFIANQRHFLSVDFDKIN